MVKNLRKIELTNRSSTITTGGTAQTAVAANADRRYLLIENPPDEVENLYVAFGATAVATEANLVLEPGAIIAFDEQVPVSTVSLIAATTGHNFVVLEG